MLHMTLDGLLGPLPNVYIYFLEIFIKEYHLWSLSIEQCYLYVIKEIFIICHICPLGWFECVTSTERTVADWTALSVKRTHRHSTVDQRRDYIKKSRELGKEIESIMENYMYLCFEVRSLITLLVWCELKTFLV